MSEVKKIPRLRFPEFEDNWNLVSINDLVSKKILDKPMDGNHGNIHPKSSDYVEEGIPFLMANNINDGKIDLENSKKISESLSETLQKGFSIEGDVLLSHKATIGETAIVPRLETKYIVLTPQVTYYRILDIDKYLNRFLLQVFRTEKFIKSMKTKAGGAGGVRLYIGITEQRNLEIPFIQISEQKKIADFLTAVDKRIELLEKKRTLLETYKKGVMKKIFNQEIRFKDDNGIDFPDWEEKRLDEISKIYQPKTISQNQFTENGYVVYGANGPIGFYSEYNHETPQVVVTCRGNSCGTVNITTPKSWITGNGMVVNVDDNPKVSKNFIYFYLVNDNLTYLITGSGQPQITGDLKNHKINIPTEIEQVKISKFLSSIDQQLELLGTQIDKSKTWKKGLLQKMFV